MSRTLAIAALLTAGCYTPPDLPLVDEVPIVAPLACGEAVEVTVACVVDGDTFDVGACGDDVGTRVRLLGVNAPEIAKSGEPSECYGDEATAEVTRRLERRTVWLTFDTECTGTFGRLLAYAWEVDNDLLPEVPTTEDIEAVGVFVNEELIEDGWARRYRNEDIEGNIRYSGVLDQAEIRAQEGDRGLWGVCEL